MENQIKTDLSREYIVNILLTVSSIIFDTQIYVAEALNPDNVRLSIKKGKDTDESIEINPQGTIFSFPESYFFKERVLQILEFYGVEIE